MQRVDVLILGGGLAGGLTAYRLREARPDLAVLVLEQAARAGGSHTWCFHDGDLTPSARAWIAPLTAKSWPAQEVRFPAHSRVLKAGYNAITDASFHAGLTTRLGEALRFGAEVVEASAAGATLADGTRIEAGAVLDARGVRDLPGVDIAFQKFAGLEVELAAPHGLDHPVIMDATVAQREGYRFVYALPFSPTRVLIEDTYYTDGPELRAEALHAGMHAYAAAQGWAIARVVRQEEGVLPLALGGDFDRAWPQDLAPIPIGMRGLFFHPVTGYSLPDAVRVADFIAQNGVGGLRDYGARLWRGRGFYRALNRMLFQAAPSAQRYRVLQRFYTMPGGVIRRFYAGETTWADAARILMGAPPVPVGPALRAAAGRHV